MLPSVKINLTNGALGSVPVSPDGVAALVLTGTATPELASLTPAVIYNIKDAEALGITASGTNAAAHRHIKEFYQAYNFISGSEVAELYIMLAPDTVTLTQQADAAVAGKLLDFAQGRVRLLGLTKVPASGYNLVVTDGVDADSLTAIGAAQTLANTYATAQKPYRTLVEMRAFLYANLASLKDLHTYTSNRVQGVLASTANDGSASVGFVMGIYAALPVQRSAARVKNGILPVTEAFVGNTKIESAPGLDTIHDKGYVVFRTFPNRAGYYLSYDPMAAPETDDYAVMMNGRVIDKAHRIAYDTYLEELNDDVEVNQEDGTLLPGYVAYLENRITDRIGKQMAGEISAVQAFIDPAQNILALGKTTVQLRIVPVGYNKQIIVDLGFLNPANN